MCYQQGEGARRHLLQILWKLPRTFVDTFIPRALWPLLPRYLPPPSALPPAAGDPGGDILHHQDQEAAEEGQEGGGAPLSPVWQNLRQVLPPEGAHAHPHRREALLLPVEGLRLEVCTLRRAQQTHEVCEWLWKSRWYQLFKVSMQFLFIYPITLFPGNTPVINPSSASCASGPSAGLTTSPSTWRGTWRWYCEVQCSYLWYYLHMK